MLSFTQPIMKGGVCSAKSCLASVRGCREAGGFAWCATRVHRRARQGAKALLPLHVLRWGSTLKSERRGSYAGGSTLKSKCRGSTVRLPFRVDKEAASAPFLQKRGRGVKLFGDTEEGCMRVDRVD